MTDCAQRMPRGTRLLVTGLSGQVGQGLIEAVAHDYADDVELVALVRRRLRSNLSNLGARMVQVVGDVTADSWGLADDDIDVGKVAAVINFAGVTDWAASQKDMDRVNYMGAVNGLRYAQHLSQAYGYTVPYVHASTVYVAGLQDGNIPEALQPPQENRTPYEVSKWYAEQHLMREARNSGHPVLIARIGAVIGSSITKSTTRLSSLYQLASPLSKGELPVLPVRAGARVDTLPRNLVGEGILRMIAHGLRDDFEHWRGGVITHLCAGENAPTLVALMTMLASKDIGNRYRTPRLVTAPDKLLRMAENVGLRYARWNRELGNRLYGLRYVSLDRIFERTRLVELADGWYPAVTLEEIIEIAFDLDYVRPAATFAELPMGRFE